MSDSPKYEFTHYAVRCDLDGTIQWCAGTKYYPAWTPKFECVRLYRRYSDAVQVIDKASRYASSSYKNFEVVPVRIAAE